MGGCKYEDSTGKILSHIIDNHSLIILNDRSLVKLHKRGATFDDLERGIYCQGRGPE